MYAVGDVALLAVLGDDGLDLEELHQKASPALDRMHAMLAQPNARA